MRAIAVLKLSTRVKDVITYGQSVVTAMTGNLYFPSPPVPLPTIQADLSALDTAETVVLTRVKGATEARNAKLVIVRGDLEETRSYVQKIADATVPPGNAQVIASAGMALRGFTPHDKPALVAKPGVVTGSVRLVAKAAARTAAYDWQYSTDQKTWTQAAPTLQANTMLTGLSAGTLYYFRVQALVRTGEQNWSQPISLIVA